MTKTLGLIGTGMIGGTVARLAVAADLNVVLSNSRGPESLADLVAPYSPEPPPQGLGQAQTIQYLTEHSVPVAIEQVRELTVNAVRGPVGGVLPKIGD